MKFELTPIVFEDWPTLWKWRNDPNVRANSHNTEIIDQETHKSYIKNLLNSKHQKQYMLLADGKKTGTIRESLLENNTLKLSYTVPPEKQGNKLGELMVRLIIQNRNETFVCEIKEGNTASIKSVERNGFKLLHKRQGVLHYERIRNH